MSQSTIAVIMDAMLPVTARFGMRAVREVPNEHCPAVVFANATTALEVRIEWRELRPFMLLMETMGKAVPDRTRLSPDSMRSFDVDDLLLLRPPRYGSPVGKLIGEGGDSAAGQLLAEYAEALQDSAADVLGGNFHVFKELERIVAQRAQLLREKAR